MGKTDYENVCCMNCCNKETKERFAEILFDTMVDKIKTRIIAGLIFLGFYIYESIILGIELRQKLVSYLDRPIYSIIIIGNLTESQSESDYNEDYYKTVVKKGIYKDCGDVGDADTIVDVINDESFETAFIAFFAYYCFVTLLGTIGESIVKFIPIKNQTFTLKITIGILNYYLPVLKMLLNLIIGPISSCDYGDCIEGPIGLYGEILGYMVGISVIVVNGIITYFLIKKSKGECITIIVMIINLPGTAAAIILYIIFKTLSKLKDINPCVWCLCVKCALVFLMILFVCFFMLASVILNFAIIKGHIGSILATLSILRIIISPVITIIYKCLVS